jgi:hypothetical protein
MKNKRYLRGIGPATRDKAAGSTTATWRSHLSPTVEHKPALLPALTAGNQLPLLVQSPSEGFVDLLRSLPVAGKRLAGNRVVPHLAEPARPSDDLIFRVRRCRCKGDNCRHRQKTNQLCHVKAPLVANCRPLTPHADKGFVLVLCIRIACRHAAPAASRGPSRYRRRATTSGVTHAALALSAR